MTSAHPAAKIHNPSPLICVLTIDSLANRKKVMIHPAIRLMANLTRKASIPDERLIQRLGSVIEDHSPSSFASQATIASPLKEFPSISDPR